MTIRTLAAVAGLTLAVGLLFAGQASATRAEVCSAQQQWNDSINQCVPFGEVGTVFWRFYEGSSAMPVPHHHWHHHRQHHHHH